MPAEPIWLPTQVVVEINLANIQGTGEGHALLFPDRLEGAMARPMNLWIYEEGTSDAISLAVSYMEGIAQAHAFEQGNKRTGFDAGFIFLRTNGYDVLPEADNELMAVAFLDLIERARTTSEFEDYIAEYVVPSG